MVKNICNACGYEYFSLENQCDDNFIKRYFNCSAKMKRIFYWYQRMFWYIGMANGEIRKPLTFTNEALQLMTYLAVIGIKTRFWYIAIIYIIIMVLMVIIGKLYVISGAPKYMARVNNQQNPEFMKILSELKEIKEKLNEQNRKT